MQDGTITYHFFETANQVDNAEAPIKVDALPQQTARADQTLQASTSASVVSFETSPAIAAFLADRLHSRPQARPESPSGWSRQLALLQRGKKSAMPARAEVRPRPTRKAARYASAAVQYQHQNGRGTVELQEATSDDGLDFDETSTDLLLRAYSSRAAAGRLDAALEVLQGVIKAGRVDVLSRSVVLLRLNHSSIA